MSAQGMNVLVLEHVRLSDLPAVWRAKLAALSATTQLTVRIEEESPQAQKAAPASLTAHPMFGMWRDREDMADVAGYVRTLRAPRLALGGARQRTKPTKASKATK